MIRAARSREVGIGLLCFSGPRVYLPFSKNATRLICGRSRYSEQEGPRDGQQRRRLITLVPCAQP
jgi:hypothetical protein